MFNGINLGRVGKWEVEGVCLLIKGFKEGRGEVTGGGRLKKSVFIKRGALNTGLAVGIIEHGSLARSVLMIPRPVFGEN